jgi:hypothetical protein
MVKSIRLFIAAVFALAFASMAHAQLDTKKLFFGAGLSQNSIGGYSNGTGFQFFGGYTFGEVAPRLHADVEVGYMDTGTMDGPLFCVGGGVCLKLAGQARGLWSTGVVRYRVAPNIELIGRAGLDFGDDDGLMVGIGAGYLLDRNLTLRAELVERSDVTSVQFNVVFRF